MTRVSALLNEASVNFVWWYMLAPSVGRWNTVCRSSQNTTHASVIAWLPARYGQDESFAYQCPCATKGQVQLAGIVYLVV